MNHQTSLCEQLSALADGELGEHEWPEVLGEVGQRDALRATWGTYHLVGEVLRSGAHAPCHEASAFLSKLQTRLAQEARHALPLPAPVLMTSARRLAEPANEPVFRWKMVAGAASLAAVAAISWNWVGVAGGAGAGAALAQVEAPPAISVLTTTPAPPALAFAPTLALRASHPAAAASGVDSAQPQQPQMILRDPRLDELLAAHQQAGGASQMPSTFLRNATFEGPAR